MPGRPPAGICRSFFDLVWLTLTHHDHTCIRCFYVSKMIQPQKILMCPVIVLRHTGHSVPKSRIEWMREKQGGPNSKNYYYQHSYLCFALPHPPRNSCTLGKRMQKKSTRKRRRDKINNVSRCHDGDNSCCLSGVAYL